MNVNSNIQGPEAQPPPGPATKTTTTKQDITKNTALKTNPAKNAGNEITKANQQKLQLPSERKGPKDKKNPHTPRDNLAERLGANAKDSMGAKQAVSTKTAEGEVKIDKMEAFEEARLKKPESGEPGQPTAEADVQYRDKNRLLKGTSSDQIDAQHREWFLNQAILLLHKQGIDTKTQNQLDSLTMQAFAKAAPIDQKLAETMEMQVSITAKPNLYAYWRSTENNQICYARQLFADDMGFKSYLELHLIDGQGLKEVFARELPHPDLDLNIDDENKFSNLVDQLLNKAIMDKYSEDKILIDFSKLLEKNQMNASDIKKCVEKFEDILLKKLDDLMRKNPELDKNKIAKCLLQKIHLVAFTKHKGQDVLLTPTFLEVSRDPRINSRFDKETHLFLHANRLYDRLSQMDVNGLSSTIDRTTREWGLRISPNQFNSAVLKIMTGKEFLSQAFHIEMAELATAGSSIPEVCKNFNDFLKMPAVSAFRNLSGAPEAPPYLKVLPLLTVSLLENLRNAVPKQGRIDQVFKDKELTDILQITYFRILNAMNEAILHKDNLTAFNNQIEMIHQMIQNILGIVEPYDEQALQGNVTAKLTKGTRPIVPEDVDTPRVHLKASSMHGMSSILASVEKQKGTNNLHVVMLKDSYYETTGNLERAKTYKTAVLDGDKFNEGGIDQAFTSSSKPAPPPKPIDLFVCEFHHNISLERKVYRPENIIAQIKEMYKQGLFADHFTVAIDTTINLEKSEDLRKLLEDPEIHKLISKGKMNLVFVRSAQKFDMLGMDNYYGGITTTINNNKSFKSFNVRMDMPDDQLKGLSYQGLSHLESLQGEGADVYRKAIMENTQRLYSKLPDEIIFKEGTTNPIQVSQIKDKNLVFIDIKFPTPLSPLRTIFYNKFLAYVKAKRLPVTSRASFGFSTTNFIKIDSQRYRLSPGLEDDKTLQQYADFFRFFQDCITEGLKEAAQQNPPIGAKELEEFLGKKIKDKFSDFLAKE